MSNACGLSPLSVDSGLQDYTSLVMRKPAFCICENKDADQLRGKALTSLAIFSLVLLCGAWTVGARWNRLISSGYPRSMFWASIGLKKITFHYYYVFLIIFLIILAAVKDRSIIHTRCILSQSRNPRLIYHWLGAFSGATLMSWSV